MPTRARCLLLLSGNRSVTRRARLGLPIALLLGACAQSGSVRSTPEGLFDHTFKLAGKDTANPVVVVVKETRRVGDVSTLQVDAPPGLGRAEGLLFMRAVCQLRGLLKKEAFTVDRDQLDRWTFHVRFYSAVPSSAPAAPEQQVFTANHCHALTLLPTG